MNSLKTSSRLLALFALPLLVLLTSYEISRDEFFVKLTAGGSAAVLVLTAFVIWVPEEKQRGKEAASLAVGVFTTVMLVIVTTGFGWYNPFTLPWALLWSLRVMTGTIYLVFISVRLPHYLISAWHLGKGYLTLYLE